MIRYFLLKSNFDTEHTPLLCFSNSLSSEKLPLLFWTNAIISYLCEFFYWKVLGKQLRYGIFPHRRDEIVRFSFFFHDWLNRLWAVCCQFWSPAADLTAPLKSPPALSAIRSREQKDRFPQHKDTKWGLVDFTHKAVVNIDGLFLLAVLACVFLVNDNLLN